MIHLKSLRPLDISICRSYESACLASTSGGLCGRIKHAGVEAVQEDVPLVAGSTEKSTKSHGKGDKLRILASTSSLVDIH